MTLYADDKMLGELEQYR